MRKKVAPSDWRDGFVFVGNHPALDFVNTHPVLSQGPVELFSSVDAILRWLTVSGLLTGPAAESIDRTRDRDFLAELLVFREEFRGALGRIERGALPDDRFLSLLNQHLREFPEIVAVETLKHGVALRKVFEPKRPRELWAPIVAAVGRLLTEAPLNRIRKCPACVLHFLDTSKKGTRVWCSMRMCGNRAKVAAFAARQRG